MKLADFETYKENPYNLEGLEQKSIYTKPNCEIGAIMDTGEILEIRRAGEKKIYIDDTLSYTKVYHGSLDKVKNFSVSALRIWCFILKSLKPKQNEIYLYQDELKEYTGYSSIPNIYKGISELLEANFIARSVGSECRYWINPNKLFNGKRI